MSLEKVNNLASTQIFQFSSPQYLQGLKIRLLLLNREVEESTSYCGFLASIFVNFSFWFHLWPSIGQN